MLEKYSFISIPQSIYPAVIIDDDKHNYTYMVSIVEYQGDYLFVNYNNVSKIDLDPENKLSILGKFAEWFYTSHSDIFQQIILENLQVYL